MARFEASVEVPASAAEVFDLVHDYDRRLEWDTLLSEARLLGGATEAGLGVSSLCVGKGRLLRLGVESVYIIFERPRVAAVQGTGGSWIFERFAASIRHQPLSEGRSRVVYAGDVRTRPRWLAWLVEPVATWAFRRETRRRLEALRAYLAPLAHTREPDAKSAST